VHTGAMTAAALSLDAGSLTSFPWFCFGSFFDLRRALLCVLEFFSEQRLFFLSAIELTPKVIDLRLQITALCILGRCWVAGRGRNRVRSRSRRALA